MASWRSFLFSYARRSRTIALAIPLALGGAALAAPGGCTLNTEGIASGGSSSSVSTTTTTASTTATTTSTGAVECVNDIDCGVAPPHSCKKKVCVSSLCADVTDLTNTPADDMKPCIAELCSGDGTPYYPAIPMGTPCQGMSGFCDGAGACVQCTADKDCPTGMGLSCDPGTHTCSSCTDGIKNGSETGKDCGGNCLACSGTSCIDGPSCLSGNCADKVCCDTACSGTCQSCNAQGSLGICISTPAGQADASCATAQACNAAGACKAAAGAPCTDSGDCALGTCIAYRCRLPTGGKCDDDALCASGLCANSVCTDCTTGSQCKSKSCAAPTCKAPSGALCLVNTDCAGGICQDLYCVLPNGSACSVSADCRSGVCKSGLCASCMNDGECSGGATCNSVFGAGACSLSKDAYCYSSTHCPPNTMCQGQPDKCQ